MMKGITRSVCPSRADVMRIIGGVRNNRSAEGEMSVMTIQQSHIMDELSHKGGLE